MSPGQVGDYSGEVAARIPRSPLAVYHGDPMTPRADLDAPSTTAAVCAALALGGLAPGCGPLAVEDLQVGPLPGANPLGCLVTFSTTVEATAEVRYGESAPDRFAVREEAPSRDHALAATGMHPDTDYALRVVAVTPSGDELVVDAGRCTSGALPMDDLRLDLTVQDRERVQPGWTLLNVAVGVTSYPPTALIVDEDGLPVWVHQVDEGDGLVDVEVSLVEGPRILLGGSMAPGSAPREVDLEGRVVWEGRAQPAGGELVADGVAHHAFSRLDDGSYLGLEYSVDEDGTTHDLIRRYDAGGTTLWTWSTAGHEEVFGGDYPWGNAALLDPDRGLAWYGSRAASRLVAIDVASGEIAWVLGEGADFQITGADPHPWFAQAHAPELVGENGLLLHDNGDAERGFSRAVEYALDLDAMTATIVWQYPPEGVDDPWYAYAMGDADRLANGDTLITTGNLIDAMTRSRVFEVTPEGEVVWELTLDSADVGLAAAPYQADRIPVLVDEL